MSDLLDDSNVLELEEGGSYNLHFSFICVSMLQKPLHTLSCQDHIVHTERVSINENVICFQNVKRADDGVYILSSRNTRGKKAFQLKVKCMYV